MTIENLSCNKSFDGWHKQYSHYSDTLHCSMRFAIYLPPQALIGRKVPALYWLSDLTCTDEHFMHKAGAQRIAAELGMAIIAPDTHPRGDEVADDKGNDPGKSAGFSVNATQPPWSRHYRMYDYVLNELPALVESLFPVSELRSIAGHAMGGYGALVMAMRNPERYRSVSAFSPICNPVNCPRGKKTFHADRGKDTVAWADYDASLLMRSASQLVPALVDQGEADEFIAEQLKPQTLEAAARHHGYPLQLNRREGYDRSYYFIASFIEQHLRFHARHLFR